MEKVRLISISDNFSFSISLKHRKYYQIILALKVGRMESVIIRLTATDIRKGDIVLRA